MKRILIMLFLALGLMSGVQAMQQPLGQVVVEPATLHQLTQDVRALGQLVPQLTQLIPVPVVVAPRSFWERVSDTVCDGALWVARPKILISLSILLAAYIANPDMFSLEAFALLLQKVKHFSSDLYYLMLRHWHGVDRIQKAECDLLECLYEWKRSRLGMNLSPERCFGLIPADLGSDVPRLRNLFGFLLKGTCSNTTAS